MFVAFNIYLIGLINVFLTLMQVVPKWHTIWMWRNLRFFIALVLVSILCLMLREFAAGKQVVAMICSFLARVCFVLGHCCWTIGRLRLRIAHGHLLQLQSEKHILRLICKLDGIIVAPWWMVGHRAKTAPCVIHTFRISILLGQQLLVLLAKVGGRYLARWITTRVTLGCGRVLARRTTGGY